MHVLEIVNADGLVLDDITFHETKASALAFALQHLMSNVDETEVVEDENVYYFQTRDTHHRLCAVMYAAEPPESHPQLMFQSKLAMQMLTSDNPVMAINAFLRHIRTQIGHG